jgi:hypothetical protein
LIIDDGIGRKMAGLYKSKSAEKHKSMGMQITMERLAHLSQDIGTAFFEVEDLEDEAGNATGTRVILKIKYTHTIEEEAFNKTVKSEVE